MAGRGDDRPLAWSDKDSEAHEAVEAQIGGSGSLAGGRNLQVMSPRVSSGGLPSGDSLGSAKPASISSMSAAEGRNGGTGTSEETRASGDVMRGTGDAGASRDVMRGGSSSSNHQQQPCSSLTSSNVPQYPQGIIPADRKVMRSLLSTSSQDLTRRA